jgi:hypothetical protein
VVKCRGLCGQVQGFVWSSAGLCVVYGLQEHCLQSLLVPYNNELQYIPYLGMEKVRVTPSFQLGLGVCVRKKWGTSLCGSFAFLDFS